MISTRMDQTLIKPLIEFGLSEKEAKTYLALLELETAGVNEISKKAEINRSSAYVVIESLKKRGLVSMSSNKKTQEFIASPPEALVQTAEEELKKQRRVIEDIEKILPNLRPPNKDSKHKPRIYVHTGKEAIKEGFDSIFDEQLSKGLKKFRVYEDMSDVKRLLPTDFVESDAAMLKKTGVKMFLISPDNPESVSVVNKYKKIGAASEFSIIPQKKFNAAKTPFGFSIYEDKVDFLSQDSFLIVIESREIADALKNLFDLAWEESKRLNKSNRN